jgi:hypothetical protein
MAAIVLLAWLLGIFIPSSLAPQRLVDGGTRTLIAVALVLVSAMSIASSCRREEPEGPVAKSEPGTRNKTTR